MKLNIKNLDLALANACLSVNELSKLSGVNITTLSRIRKGTQEPMPKTIGKLARALKCKTEDLIED
ncbi:helix-turn-helix domain-containing protein [Anaerocolumna sp.]|uniref:helix-turn-helix domain-containing protein n=1 Tax=Anaerocolumna sp. TaxID=2041569 RepID=UPI0028AE2051|nr:helix-turn-helix transcriptional regulator [Anaerocolumna sp.]